jgi:hypothetical protein
MLGDNPSGGPPDAPLTLAMVCNYGFDIRKPNAASTFRLGLCRGFAQTGARYWLLGVGDISKILPELTNPIVALSGYDYEYMDRSAIRTLRNYPHIVWVDPDASVLREFWRKHGVRYEQRLPVSVPGKIMESGPRFLWGNTTRSHLHCFSEWDRRGFKVIALPLALDTDRYFPEPGNLEFTGVRMAFVGGYWAKKSVQFDRYLKPYEDLLTVYGYSKWPYRNYQGPLPEDQERVLYQNARISPAISESDVERTGDIVERVYKVLGSGGLAVTDVAPAYADLFAKDELLYPETIGEYHDMIREALADDGVTQKYRKRGLEAVLARHTYRHRARQILDELGMACLLDQA